MDIAEINETVFRGEILSLNTTAYSTHLGIERTTMTKDLSSYLEVGPYFKIFDKIEGYVIGGVFLLMAALGIVLNSLTICIVSLGRHIRTEFKLQLTNLAIADLFMAALDPAYHTMFYMRLPFPNSSPLCQVFAFISIVADYTSLLCKVAISLERFLIIYFPLRASRYNQRHKFAVVVIIWLCSLLIGIDSLLGATILEYNGKCFCVNNEFPHDSTSMMFNPWARQLKYALPAGTIIIVYILIFFKLRHQNDAGMRRNLSSRWSKDLKKVPAFMLLIDFHNNLLTKFLCSKKKRFQKVLFTETQLSLASL